jgi:hypothetical protein
MIRKGFIGFFAVLALGFVLRAFQYGYKWMTGVTSPDVNYKALTIWCLVYVLVCVAVAWGISRLSADRSDDTPRAHTR